jgi:hypothetical protein
MDTPGECHERIFPVPIDLQPRSVLVVRVHRLARVRRVARVEAGFGMLHEHSEYLVPSHTAYAIEPAQKLAQSAEGMTSTTFPEHGPMPSASESSGLRLVSGSASTMPESPPASVKPPGRLH